MKEKKMTLSNKQVLELANAINQSNENKAKASQDNASFKNLFMHDYMQKFYANDIEGLKFYKENISKDKPMEKQKAIISQAKTAIRVIASGQHYEIASLPNRILTPSDIIDNEKPIAIYSQLVKVAKDLRLDSSSIKQADKQEKEKEKFIEEAILSNNPMFETIGELKRSVSNEDFDNAKNLACLQWDELQNEAKQAEVLDNLQKIVDTTMQNLADIKDADYVTYCQIVEGLIKDLQKDEEEAA